MEAMPTKISAISGVQSLVAVDYRYPDHEARQGEARQHVFKAAAQTDPADDAGQPLAEDLPLATTGSLGTLLNLRV
jgi:hypothetical protein